MPIIGYIPYCGKDMKMNRRTAREITLSLVFEYSFNTDVMPEELLKLYLNYNDFEPGVTVKDVQKDKYITSTYAGVVEKLSEIDPLIAEASHNWHFDRISRVAQAILRLAAYEILYIDDIPPKVSVNEAVELAKKYDEEKSYTFINGILGNIIRKVNSEKAEAQE